MILFRLEAGPTRGRAGGFALIDASEPLSAGRSVLAAALRGHQQAGSCRAQRPAELPLKRREATGDVGSTVWGKARDDIVPRTSMVSAAVW